MTLIGCEDPKWQNTPAAAIAPLKGRISATSSNSQIRSFFIAYEITTLGLERRYRPWFPARRPNRSKASWIAIPPSVSPPQWGMATSVRLDVRSGIILCVTAHRLGLALCVPRLRLRKETSAAGGNVLEILIGLIQLDS